MTVAHLGRFALRAVVSLALLLDYVEKFNALGKQPRWYNALTQNCTTTIWFHTKAVGTGRSLDWRLLANGYLPDLGYERATVNTSIPLEALKHRSDITMRARAAGASEDFSRDRGGLPPRPSGGPAAAAKPRP